MAVVIVVVVMLLQYYWLVMRLTTHLWHGMYLVHCNDYWS